MTSDSTILRKESPLNKSKAMTQEEALQVIDYHQKWRKGADVPQTDVKELSEALDLLPILVKEKDREIAELDEQLQLQHDHIKELKQWKEQALILNSHWDKIVEFAQTSDLFTVGESVSEKTLELLKQVAELKAEGEKLADRITELLNESIDSGMEIRKLKADITNFKEWYREANAATRAQVLEKLNDTP